MPEKSRAPAVFKRAGADVAMSGFCANPEGGKIFLSNSGKVWTPKLGALWPIRHLKAQEQLGITCTHSCRENEMGASLKAPGAGVVR